MSPSRIPPGRCPGCRDEGRVGHPCERGSCRRSGLHFIPESDVASAGRLRDVRVGKVVGGHLLVARLRREDSDPIYRALQLPALLEVELALAATDRAGEVHDNLFRQALALARLDHPNLIRLVAFGVDAAGTYLATVPVQGGAEMQTLAELIEGHGGRPVPLEEARLIIEPLARALAALSEAQLVHGEIRPEHVLVRALPGYPAFVQLAGFVRLPFEDPERRAVRDLVWQPPEQIDGHVVGPTTDAYAVAAIAFALLFGRPPFPDDDRERMLRAKTSGDDPTDGLGAAAPPETLAFFRTALAADRDARFGDLDDMTAGLAQALDAFASHERPPHVAPARTGPILDYAPRTLSQPVLAVPTPPPRRVMVEEPPSVIVAEPEPEPEPDIPAHRPGGTSVLRIDEVEAIDARRPVPRMHVKHGRTAP